ncbi:MAG: site-specific DNA-methyltransferase [Deltaproteobacteria bacterium]|nr:site-specific DNA-methyltransferase [Deltaproteobacteria bacterium]
MTRDHQIRAEFDINARAVVHQGDCLDFLKTIPDNSVQLIVTSPPYNIGKEYEKKLRLEHYVERQEEVIVESFRVLKDSGSICWQVGNYVDSSSIVPIDSVLFPVFSRLGMKMRNRIVWHFEHGLHCTKRFSGRYETIIWYTKSDQYVFNLDPVRVPQKYPGKKYFKGPKTGQYSCNPLGKNPGDLWTIPNVKSNHIEKTVHPCQFPVELVERLVLSLTDEGDWVLDPFLGVGSTIVAAVLHSRRGAGADVERKYLEIARKRIQEAFAGTIKLRPMDRPVYDPKAAGNRLTVAPWAAKKEAPYTPVVGRQLALLEKPIKYGADT